MQSEADALHILSLVSPRRPRAQEDTSAAAQSLGLKDFVLVKKDVLNEEQLVMLNEIFFEYHHHFYVS